MRVTRHATPATLAALPQWANRCPEHPIGLARTRIGTALILGGFVLTACVDPAPIAEPGVATDNAAAGLTSKQVDRPAERPFEEIAKAVPEFGGYFFENGRPVVYMTNPGKSDVLLPVLRPVLDALRAIGGDAAVSGEVEIRRADYSFLELAEWRDKVFDDVFGIPDVVSLDLNEAINRVEIGLETGVGRPDVEEWILGLGIPLGAVHVEVTGAFRPSSHTLNDSVRPLVGGLRGNWLGSLHSGCTWSFVALYSGSYYLLTASHCGQFQWQLDYADWYQPGSPNGFIGEEEIDPPAWRCGPFWDRDWCRKSDAAGIRLTTSDHKFGFIARTTGRGNGSNAIDHANSTMQVVAEIGTVPSGWTVDMIGRNSGWTFGQVTHTCKDLEAGDYHWICQEEATYPSQGGDSGAPVFLWSGDSTVTLAGIHVGTNVGNGRAIFTPMSNIEEEIGSLITFYSVPIGGPTEVTVAGTYTWEAFPVPTSGSHSYQWSVEYFIPPSTVNLGTAKTQQLYVDASTGHFEMRVTATSGSTGATASDTHFVNNNISGGPEGAEKGGQ